MQSPNNEPSGKQEGKNRALIIFGLLILALLCYKIFCSPEPPAGPEITGVIFDPANAGVLVDSLGNRDMQVNPDEQVKVQLRLTNSGKTPIAAFDLVFMAQDSGVVLIDNRVHFNALKSGESALSEDTFEFKMPRRFPMACVTFHGKTAGAKRAGLIGAAFAGIPEHDIDVALPVAPNFHVCVVACALTDNVNAPDILTMELKLCNASLKPDAATAGDVLSDAAVTIHAITIKACQNYIVRAPAETITAIPPAANTAAYGTVAAGTCTASGTFTFEVPSSWAQSVPLTPNPTLCIHFTAEIFSNASSLSKTSEGFAFVGVSASVMRVTPEVD